LKSGEHPEGGVAIKAQAESQPQSVTIPHYLAQESLTYYLRSKWHLGVKIVCFKCNPFFEVPRISSTQVSFSIWGRKVSVMVLQVKWACSQKLCF